MAKRKQITKRSLPKTSQGRSVVRQHVKRINTRAAQQRATTALSATQKQTLTKRRFRITRKGIILFLILVGLIALAVYKKDWFVAGMVNNKPILNVELQNRMNKLYRQQTLNQIVNERVIYDEARKKNVTVSESDIDERIKSIETDVGGGESLDALLSQQQQTRSDLRNQLKIQMTIEKLYGQEASPSAEDVAKYISENKEQLRASDSAGQEKEAVDTLRQQKLSQIFNEKFQELRNSANIQLF